MSATTEKRFHSYVDKVGIFKSDWEQNIIKKEPMFFNCSPEFAHSNGGAITKNFIESLPTGWYDAVIDTRVHMLMPGWYPAIPGWHHDDVPRAIIPPGQHFITAGQPDYDNPRYKAEHIMGLVNGEICPTNFALGICNMPAIPEGELIYRRWHEEVEILLNKKFLTPYSIQSGELLQFNWQTFHTGQKAISSGWRWFGRISRNTDRVKNITNEIRSQVQVYLEFPMEGW